MRPEVTRRSALKSALSAGVGGVAGALGLPLLGHRPSGNIIFIVCDALRADRIVYRRRAPGGARFIMPTLGRLAREGVSMEMAVAPSSWTPISMGAILFNTNPLNVSYGRGDFEVRNAQPGIAERLSAEGFYTACITANYLLDSPVIRRGFDDFTAMQRSDAEPGGRPLETSSLGVNRAAFSLLPRMRRSRRFFLYLHYMETHEPYFCPDPVLRELGASFSPPAFTSRVRTAYMRKDTHLSRKIPMEEGIRQLITHYDAAALFLDTAIRRLLGKLEVEGLLDDSVVIVTSDHGEEFADNTETQPTFGHNQNLSQMQIHSPLIFWPRHACAAHRCMRAAPVSSATAINSALDAFLHGKRPLPGGRPIVSYLNFAGINSLACITGNVKLVAHLDEEGRMSRVVAYRLGRDFARPRPARLSQVGEPVIEMMREMIEKGGQPTLTGGDLDPNLKERLRALGYLN